MFRAGPSLSWQGARFSHLVGDKRFWAETSSSRNLESVLLTMDVNFFGRLKDAFHSLLAGADIWIHCKEVQ